MQALIVQSNESLGKLWQRHLERLGVTVALAQTGTAALHSIQSCKFDVIVLDLVLSDDSALTVADFAQFRLPQANVIFVTDTTFFSDGSIFSIAANARAFIKSNTAPSDLAAIVEHYGNPSPARAVRPNLVPG